MSHMQRSMAACWISYAHSDNQEKMFATFFNNSYREPVAIPTLPQLDSETQIITVKTIDTVDVQWWISDMPPLMSLFDQQITEMFWKPLTADVQHFWSVSSLVPRPHPARLSAGVGFGSGTETKVLLPVAEWTWELHAPVHWDLREVYTIIPCNLIHTYLVTSRKVSACIILATGNVILLSTNNGSCLQRHT